MVEATLWTSQDGTRNNLQERSVIDPIIAPRSKCSRSSARSSLPHTREPRTGSPHRPRACPHIPRPAPRCRDLQDRRPRASSVPAASRSCRPAAGPTTAPAPRRPRPPAPAPSASNTSTQPNTCRDTAPCSSGAGASIEGAPSSILHDAAPELLQDLAIGSRQHAGSDGESGSASWIHRRSSSARACAAHSCDKYVANTCISTHLRWPSVATPAGLREQVPRQERLQ